MFDPCLLVLLDSWLDSWFVCLSADYAKAGGLTDSDTVDVWDLGRENNSFNFGADSEKRGAGQWVGFFHLLFKISKII